MPLRSTMATRLSRGVVGRRHRGLPHLALVALAIAQQHVGARRPAVQAGGERGAHAEREALAQRAAGHLHAGRLYVRVTLQTAVDLAEGHQLFGLEVPRLGERRVQHGAGVGLAEHEAVARLPRRVGGTVAQGVEVEGRQDLDSRERAAGVAAVGLRDHGEYVATHAARGGPQGVQIESVGIAVGTRRFASGRFRRRGLVRTEHWCMHLPVRDAGNYSNRTVRVLGCGAGRLPSPPSLRQAQGRH